MEDTIQLSDSAQHLNQEPEAGQLWQVEVESDVHQRYLQEYYLKVGHAEQRGWKEEAAVKAMQVHGVSGDCPECGYCVPVAVQPV